MKNIEIVEFYPLDSKITDRFRQPIIGTIHIRIKFLDIDIRGIEVYKGKNKYNFQFPWATVVREGERVRFPLVAFHDKERQRAFMKELNTEGKIFLKEHFKIELEVKEEEG